MIDASRGERRFRVKSLLFEGASYQIALAEDTALDDKQVCVKTIAYDSKRLQDKAYVVQRRKALHQEMTFLTLSSHLLPEPLDWIQLEESETVLSREPVLVYEYMPGETLFAHVKEKHPTGMAPFRALRLIREVAGFLAEIHDAGWVFRNLDPRHIIISVDDIIHMVGASNAAKMGERPLHMQNKGEWAYIAPEIREELSGQFIKRQADLYSLAALFSFLVTGEEPRESVENPLTRAAYEKLAALEPQGLTLLVAKNMQPMAKNRQARIEKFLEMSLPQTLPTPQSKDFGMMALPAPWTGAESPDSRAVKSSLSPGPLISVERQAQQQSKDQGQLEAAEPQGCRGILSRLFNRAR